jgi:hypothetical protein
LASFYEIGVADSFKIDLGDGLLVGGELAGEQQIVRV